MRFKICVLRLFAWSIFSFCLEQSACAQIIRPLPVPGRIEAEDYDVQGAGISFHDNSPGNNGDVYRQDDVDIETTQDAGGGFNVGWVASGEWLHFTLHVAETAVYQLAFRVAAAQGSGVIYVSLDGSPLCTVPAPQTGGWQNWQTVTVSNLALRAGTRLLRVHFQTGGCNLNYIDITKQKNLDGFLRVSGKQIVNGQGENVLLRGMGLGNWMLQEPYMMEVSGIVDNQQQLKKKIAELVGNNHAAAFYQSWLTNYFREEDVAALANAGFNSLRLPMHYALFTLPIEAETIPGSNTWLETGFDLVDDLLSWCETHQIYLILDMHAAPGGQGHDRPISDYNPPAPSLWESAANRSKLIALWREIARRYADRTWIAGYDLINEPNWSFENSENINGCSDTANVPLKQLLSELTSVIREVDTNHILFLGGNCWGNNYQGILPPWDANSVVSFHKYWDSPAPESLQTWVSVRDQWSVPVWLGESGENSNEWFREVVRNVEQFNIGWCWWPWKKIGGISGTVTIQKPAGYQAILDYWRGNGPRPTTNAAVQALLQLAQAARFENCIVHLDVFDALMRPQTGGITKPFKSNTIPGVIFATEYDLGAFNEAYYDTTTNGPHNSGNAYRNDSVDMEVCTDAPPSNGFNLGWLDAGDWLKYSLTPLAGGSYAVSARVAGGNAGGSFFLELNGTNASGIVAVPFTGGWQSWQTIPVATLQNLPNPTALKLVVVSGGFNLNWLKFEPVQPPKLKANQTSEGNVLNLSWPAWADEYSLRSATNLVSPISWTPITNSIVHDSNEFVVTLPMDAMQRYFRLQKE